MEILSKRSSSHACHVRSFDVVLCRDTKGSSMLQCYIVVVEGIGRCITPDTNSPRPKPNTDIVTGARGNS
jgi:hypothetical protein